ncbi:MAG: hypothetical protein U0174_18430 [Polyangiaceae bacterium]
MREGRFSLLEWSIGLSLLGTVLAVAVPSCLRDLQASHLAEATNGITRMANAAVAYKEAHGQFPKSAPLTPTVPPRGMLREDPPGTWDHPTWKALDFRATREGVPHAYCFQFDSDENGFRARAQGDLDGDGILSTFELRGTSNPPRVLPGMFVDSELE